MAELQPSAERGDAGGLYAVLIILAILILATVFYFSGILGPAEPQAPAAAKAAADSAAVDTSGTRP
jgi:hypothetical protein